MNMKMGHVARLTACAALLAAGMFHTRRLAAQESELGICLGIIDVAERVKCYDAIARAEQARAAPRAAASPAPPVPAPMAPAAAGQPLQGGQDAAAPRAEFGLSAAQRESLRPAEERQLDEISAVVSSSQRIGAGYWQFVMRDGAVWRLMENRTRFRAPSPGDKVTIRRGSLGSYFLDADGQPTLRIKRIG